MPHISIVHGTGGPLIDLWVSVSSARLTALKLEGRNEPPWVLVKALVDTGASHTAIDLELVSQLELTPTGSVYVVTPTTGEIPHTQNTYDVGFHVPLGSEGNVWSFPIWVASAAELRHQGFSVLFGRDLLAGSTLHYDGKNGLFTLTF